MKANEQDKVYCRSIRPDGYGEGAVPEMEEPRCRVWPGEGTCEPCKRYEKHLASLPVLYLIHRDLHKGKVGWVGECRERYEVVNDVGKWVAVDESWYSCMKERLRRIVLVPVGGKEHHPDHWKNFDVLVKSAVDKAFSESGLKNMALNGSNGNFKEVQEKFFCSIDIEYLKSVLSPSAQPADKAEEKEVNSTFEGWPEKYPDLQSVTEEEKNQMIEELTKTITKNVVATFKTLGLKTHIKASVYEEHFGEWFQFSFIKCANEQEASQFAKPTPVTGDARESFWTDDLVLDFAVRSHLGRQEMTIEEFKKMKLSQQNTNL